MPDQMLTVTFRIPKTTIWQQKTLEKFGDVYAETVVRMCRWALSHIDFSEMDGDVDARRVLKLLPKCEEVNSESRILHGCLREDLRNDVAAKLASYVQLMKMHENRQLRFRPGFWASRVKEPRPYEQLLKEAIYREFETNDDFLDWQGNLLSHGWLSKATRPQLGEQLLFLGTSGARRCHVLVRRKDGELQAAAVLYIAAKGVFPGVVIPPDAGWLDLCDCRPYTMRSRSVMVLPLLTRSEYIRKFLEVSLGGMARPAAAKLYRKRRNEYEKWTWFLAVTFRVQCPQPYEAKQWLEVESTWLRGSPPSVAVRYPNGECVEVFAQLYENHLKPAMSWQFVHARNKQKRMRDTFGLHRVGAEWERCLHVTARSIVAIAQSKQWGVRWVGGAPFRLKRLPDYVMRKARLAGVPARWVKKTQTREASCETNGEPASE
jgi:hypothetical protein